jgi:thiamine biosynthesis lipoprotein
MDRRRFLRWTAGAGLALLAGPVVRAAAAVHPETSRCWMAMGTLLEIRIPDLPAPEAVAVMRSIRGAIEDREAAMTLFRTGGALSVLNRARPGAWVRIGPRLHEALERAAEAAALRPGFDPTVAPMVRAEGFLACAPAPPDAAARRRWRNRPGMAALELDPGDHRARRLHADLELDLGAIGKGIAVDAALALLAQAGSRSALVDFGGEIGVLGPPPGMPGGWPVGIAHPRDPGSLWAELRLARGHLATSGDYVRRRRTASGVRHHLIDPRRGEPTAGVPSLTVWAESGTAADAASTADLVEAACTGRVGKHALAVRKEGGGLAEERTGVFAQVPGVRAYGEGGRAAPLTMVRTRRSPAAGF